MTTFFSSELKVLRRMASVVLLVVLSAVFLASAATAQPPSSELPVEALNNSLDESPSEQASNSSGDQRSQVRILLNQMRQTMQTMNYTGVFIFQQGQQLKTMQVAHQATPLGEQERLVSLDGPPMEIVRQDGQVMCYLPQLDGTITTTSQPRNPFTVALPRNLDSISQHYDLRFQGMDRVAGRLVRVVSIAPNDEFRYGYRLWLDAENHMLLKALIGERGKAPVEQMLFTQIDYPEEVPSYLLQSQFAVRNLPRRDASNGASNGMSADPTDDVVSMPLDDRWQFELPAGFVLKPSSSSVPESPVGMTKSPNLSSGFEHRMYSDGLASVSVFITPAPNVDDSASALGASRMGALHAFTRTLNGYQITVLGDVPAATVEFIATNVSRPD